MESGPLANRLGEIDGPIYGLVTPTRGWPTQVTVNCFSPEFGGLPWQIAAAYERDDSALVSVYTIFRRTVASTAGDGRAESGLREAKGLVAGDLGATRNDPDIADRAWESATLSVDGIVSPAFTLTTDRGTGWVLELEAAVVGLVGFDPSLDSVGRIHPARP